MEMKKKKDFGLLGETDDEDSLYFEQTSIDNIDGYVVITTIRKDTIERID